MVANPETNRLNGRKSCGSVTIRGRAISSKNATKHGALAKSPPILITEDLESFQGIVQSLIDEYQPASATDQLLIQQVAMGWLRLHWLWGAEAASANIEILKVQSAAKFPNPKCEALLGVKVAKLQRSATRWLENDYSKGSRKTSYFFSIQPKILEASWC